MDLRANYMPVIPAVVVLKIYPNARDIQGQTWWLLLPENKEAKDQPINSWICKPQLNSFLYKATWKGLQDMRETSQEEDEKYSCKQATERKKVSTVHEKRQSSEAEIISMGLFTVIFSDSKTNKGPFHRGEITLYWS